MTSAPSLLDRLTDADPSATTEPAAAAALSLRDMRRIIRRDLIWLLTTIRLEEVTDLESWDRARASVINYGVRDLSGVPEKNLDTIRIENSLRRALVAFEPRLNPDSVDIELVPFDEAGQGSEASRGVAKLHISADWANDLYGEAVVIEATIDFETGGIEAQGTSRNG